MNKYKQKLTAYCSDLPWCDFNQETLGTTVMDFVWQKESFYRRWCQKWFENFQFVYGNHDVKWVRQFGFAIDTDFLTRKKFATAKKSKTNISRLVAETLTAAIYARQPKWDVTPASDSARQSKNISQMTQNLLDYLMKILDCHARFRVAAAGYTTYGKVGAVVRWNQRSGVIKWVPKWRRVKKPVMTTMMKEDVVLGGVIETTVQAIDSIGQPMFEDTWEPVLNNEGEVAQIPQAQGCPEIQILTPFEYRYEEGKSIKDAKWVEWIRLIDYDDFLREYSDLDGKTKYFDQITPDMSTQRVHQYAIRQFFRMHYISPDYDSKPVDMATSGVFLKNKVLVIEHYDKPDVDLWPYGRRVIIANGQCTHVTQPDFSVATTGGWHPFCEALWFNIAPSCMPCSAMNDVVQKNKELNVADSLILTALHRNMGSSLLVKIGSGLDPTRVTGNPGDIHEVNDLQAAKFLHDEQPISPSIPMIRQNIKDDVFEGSGAQDSLRGERSKNVSAGYALRQLQEREERRIAPARDVFEEFIANIGEKLVACFRTKVQSVGDDIMGYLKRSAAGEFLPDEAVTFLTRNIEIGVDINIEPGSMQVESKATKQYNLLDLVTKTSFGQKLSTDAKVADNFLKEFGAETLRGYAGAHTDRASMENELFTDMLRLGPDRLGQSLPIVIFEDDDNIHIQEHSDFLIRNASDMTKNQAVMLQFLQHIEKHRIQDKEKKGEVPPGSTQATQIAQSVASRNPVNTQQIQAEIQQRKLEPPPPAPSSPPKESPEAPKQAEIKQQTPAQNTQPAQ
jgi:hypothetical protein